MKDNYSNEQVSKIIYLADRYNKTPDQIRNMLDAYWDGNFDSAIDSLHESLQLFEDEMVAESQMIHEVDDEEE